MIIDADMLVCSDGLDKKFLSSFDLVERYLRFPLERCERLRHKCGKADRHVQTADALDRKRIEQIDYPLRCIRYALDVLIRS